VDHVHILVQSIPTITVSRIVTIIKSITAKEIFKEWNVPYKLDNI